MPIRMSRVHLAPASADKRFTARLARDLRARGRDVWYAQWDLLDSLPSFEDLLQRVPEQSALALVVSAASSGAPCLAGPPPANLGTQLARRGLVVLVVQADECELPPRLSDLSRADFRGEYTRGLSALLSHLEQSVPIPGPAAAGAPPAASPSGASDRERAYFENVLKQCRGDLSQAARVAGMDFDTFHAALRRAGIDPLKFRS